MAPAVVLGLDSITGLQTARILAGRGVPVVGVALDTGHFASRSRSCHRVIGAAPHRLVSVLHELNADVGRPFVVVPCSDAWVMALVTARRMWPPHVRTVMPEYDTAETLMDKARFARFAVAHGVPVPATVVVEDDASLVEATEQLSFPVVMKPARKPDGWDETMGGKVTVVADKTHLTAVARKGLGLVAALVVQEWVPGDESGLVSYNGYFDRQSQPLAGFVARKLRQWPPGAGTSASGEEVRDDEVLDLAVELFQKAGFQGLAYLEVKRSPEGRLLVIEPNVGRPTGRSAISEAGGVELVLSAYRDALGMTALPANRQTYRGVKWVYLRHDVQAAAVAVRAGDLTWGQWLRSLRGPKAFAVWSLRDPLPFFVDVYHTVHKLIASAGRKRWEGQSRSLDGPAQPRGKG